MIQDKILIDRNGSAQNWTGKITKVGDLKQAAVVDEEQGGNPNLSQFSFEVSLDNSDTPPTIGLHCFVELIEEEEKETKIPKMYVFSENKQTYVFVDKKGKVAKQKVQVEPSSDDELYILKSSLAKTTKLIFPDKGVKEGMAVDSNDSVN